MTTSDERIEVAEALRGLRHSTYYSEEVVENIKDAIGIADPVNTFREPEDVYELLAELIDPTCVYEPTETLTRWDENDYEHETNEPDPDCATFVCSRCGYEMIYGDEYGWFDTEPPYTPHFRFCPNCRARVLPLKLYDKVVTYDGD